MGTVRMLINPLPLSERAARPIPAPVEAPPSDAATVDDEAEKRGFKIVNEQWDCGRYNEIDIEEPAPDPRKFVFIVRRRFNPAVKPGQVDEPTVFVSLCSPHLIRVIRKRLEQDEDILSDVPTVPARSIFLIKDDLKRHYDETVRSIPNAPEHKQDELDAPKVKKRKTTPDEDSANEVVLTRDDLQAEVEHLDLLKEWLSEAFSDVQSKLDRMLPQNQISWSLLWCLFRKGTKVVTAHEGTNEMHGSILTQASYVHTAGGSGGPFGVSGYYMVWDGRGYQKIYWTKLVPKFTGTIDFADLPCRPLSAKAQEALRARGRLVVSFAGIKYLAYDGVLVQTMGCGMNKRVIKAPATGRVMIDVAAFRRKKPMMDPFREDNDEYDDSHATAKDSNANIPEDDYWMLPPTLHGFSFHLKDWGEMSVEKLSPVKFSRDAFEHLVLPDGQKRLIRGIVDATRPENQGAIVKDLISGKGEGITICLHGPPGSGKTLTAEAVGELLERPLYVVGSGELGTDAGAVEENLREVFDLAETWNAVILIDEGDVFLETRSLHELARNSLVSTFLRLLDFSRATLFITTNRIRAFDPAVLSRIHAAFKYSSLDQHARLKVWTRLLELAGVAFQSDVKSLVDAVANVTPSISSSPVTTKTGEKLVTKEDLMALAAKPLDGRSIRNAVLSAQRIAISEGAPLSLDHLYTVISYLEAFHRDFTEVPADVGRIACFVDCADLCEGQTS